MRGGRAAGQQPAPNPHAAAYCLCHSQQAAGSCMGKRTQRCKAAQRWSRLHGLPRHQRRSPSTVRICGTSVRTFLMGSQSAKPCRGRRGDGGLGSGPSAGRPERGRDGLPGMQQPLCFHACKLHDGPRGIVCSKGPGRACAPVPRPACAHQSRLASTPHAAPAGCTGRAACSVGPCRRRGRVRRVARTALQRRGKKQLWRAEARRPPTSLPAPALAHEAAQCAHR